MCLGSLPSEEVVTPPRKNGASIIYGGRFATAEKFYKGKPCRTRKVSEYIRIFTDESKRKRVDLEDSTKKRQRQATCGVVKPFTTAEAITTKCCNRRCLSQFSDADDPDVIALREPLYDATLTPKELKSALRDRVVCFFLSIPFPSFPFLSFTLFLFLLGCCEGVVRVL